MLVSGKLTQIESNGMESLQIKAGIERWQKPDIHFDNLVDIEILKI